MDKLEGRIFLSFLHLLADNNDSLALRTLLILRNNQIGKKSYSALYQLARKNGKTFAESAYDVMEKPELIPNLGGRIGNEIQEIQKIIGRHRSRFEGLNDSSEPDELLDSLNDLAKDVIRNTDIKTEILEFLISIIEETNSTDHRELLRTLSLSLEDKSAKE